MQIKVTNLTESALNKICTQAATYVDSIGEQLHVTPSANRRVRKKLLHCR